MNTYLGYKCKYAKNALIPQKHLNFGIRVQKHKRQGHALGHGFALLDSAKSGGQFIAW